MEEGQPIPDDCQIQCNSPSSTGICGSTGIQFSPTNPGVVVKGTYTGTRAVDLTIMDYSIFKERKKPITSYWQKDCMNQYFTDAAQIFHDSDHSVIDANCTDMAYIRDGEGNSQGSSIDVQAAKDCCTGEGKTWNSVVNKCYVTLKAQTLGGTYRHNDHDDLYKLVEVDGKIFPFPDADDVCRKCCNQELPAGEPGSCDMIGQNEKRFLAGQNVAGLMYTLPSNDEPVGTSEKVVGPDPTGSHPNAQYFRESTPQGDPPGMPYFRCGTTGNPKKERTFPATCYKGIRKRSRVCCTQRQESLASDGQTVITGCQEGSLAGGFCQHTIDDHGNTLVTGQSRAAGSISQCNRWYYTDVTDPESIIRDDTINQGTNPSPDNGVCAHMNSLEGEHQIEVMEAGELPDCRKLLRIEHCFYQNVLKIFSMGTMARMGRPL